MYTKSAAIPIKLYKIVCRTGACNVYWSGFHDSIFRLSTGICAGYEIGWEFVEAVSRTKSNFSAFCYLCNETYKRHDQNAKSFMSANTFRKWFFSWASHQEIDFRSQCTFCGDSPEILACDGTKVGIARKNLSIIPIETSTRDEFLPTLSRRNNRCFLRYPVANNTDLTGEQRRIQEKLIREARSHLKYRGKFKLTHQTDITEDQMKTRDDNLISVVSVECKPLLINFLNQRMSMEQLEATGNILILLSYDAPMRAIISGPLVPILRQLITDIELGDNINFKMVTADIKCFSNELSFFINSFVNDGGTSFDTDALDFIKCITSMSAEMPITVPEEANPIIGSYNPQN